MTSAIALGRLITSVALLAATTKKKGTTSVQFVTRTTLRQLFADANHDGHLRGFAKNADLAFPLFAGETVGGRRSLAPALKPGELSVIRSLERTGEYSQSSTPITRGEVDEDLEFFLEQSDQIPTALAADVLVNLEGMIQIAAGVLVQALPDGDIEEIARIRSDLREGALERQLCRFQSSRSESSRSESSRTGLSPSTILRNLIPKAEIIDMMPLAWRCGCSREKVISSLRMFSPADLIDMASDSRDVEIHCDMCGETYAVEPETIAKVFGDQIKAHG